MLSQAAAEEWGPGDVCDIAVADPRVGFSGLTRFVDYEVLVTLRGSSRQSMAAVDGSKNPFVEVARDATSDVGVSRANKDRPRTPPTEMQEEQLASPPPAQPPTTCSVRRRYRDFKWLYERLQGEGFCLLPSLPPAHWLGNLSMEYTDPAANEARRRSLHWFLQELVLRYHETARSLSAQTPTVPKYIRHSDALRTFLFASEGDLAMLRVESNSHGLARYLNPPIKFSLESEVEKASYALLNFLEEEGIMSKHTVALDLLKSCSGIACLTLVKGGFLFSGGVGTGLVVARHKEGGWTGPCAIGVARAGWGLQVGGEVTDILMILPDQNAVDAFCGTAQLHVGTEIGASFGPLGRAAASQLQAGNGAVSTVFAYAHCKGFFAGISFQASFIAPRSDVNEEFYGQSASANDILSSKVPCPEKAAPLLQALHRLDSEVGTFDSTAAADSRGNDGGVGYPQPPTPGRSSRMMHFRGLPPLPSEQADGPVPPDPDPDLQHQDLGAEEVVTI